jgi:lysozyme
MKFLPWWAYLGDVRKRVLVNMAFNLGIAGLLKFENTLALIRSGSYAQAAAEMVEKQVGKAGRQACRPAGKHDEDRRGRR